MEIRESEKEYRKFKKIIIKANEKIKIIGNNINDYVNYLLYSDIPNYLLRKELEYNLFIVNLFSKYIDKIIESLDDIDFDTIKHIEKNEPIDNVIQFPIQNANVYDYEDNVYVDINDNITTIFDDNE